mmetsp:Transcript_47015/g.91772  ORF Transcript_47015/g.91772 Transcript_47015/m.91772 type:complete len:84 (+) Transcript_47015:322-573(+)
MRDNNTGPGKIKDTTHRKTKKETFPRGIIKRAINNANDTVMKMQVNRYPLCCMSCPSITAPIAFAENIPNNVNATHVLSIISR